MNIFNTHLQATYFGTTEYHWNITVDTRIDQINELCKYIKEISNESKIDVDEKILIAGDFNVDAHCYETKIKVNK